MIRTLRRLLPSMPRHAAWIVLDSCLMTALVLSIGLLGWSIVALLNGGTLCSGWTHCPDAVQLTLAALTPRQSILSLGIPVVIGSLLFMTLFYIPYRKELTIGALRDVLVVLLFSGFVATLFRTMGLVAPVLSESSFDAILLTACGSTFLIIAIANFGGVADSNKGVAIELGTLAIVVLAAEALGMTGGKTWQQVLAGAAVDLSVIYVLSFCTKLLLFPGDFLTIELKSVLGRTIFGVAALLFLLPVVAMCLMLLGVGAYALVRMAVGGPEVVFAFPPFAPLAPVLGTTAYVVGLLLNDPLAGLAVCLGVVYSVLRFADEQASELTMLPGFKHRLVPASLLALALGLIVLVAAL